MIEPGSRAPVGSPSATDLTEPIALPRSCTQMPPIPRPAAELLQEEKKIFERLVALCVEHGLPPQVPRFISNGATEASVLPVMRASAPGDERSLSDVMAHDLLDAVNEVRRDHATTRGVTIKPIGDVDSLMRNVLSKLVPAGDVAAFTARAAELGIAIETVPGRTRYARPPSSLLMPCPTHTPP